MPNNIVVDDDDDDDDDYCGGDHAQMSHTPHIYRSQTFHKEFDADWYGISIL